MLLPDLDMGNRLGCGDFGNCAEIKVRAERRMGQLLGDMEKHQGAATPSQNERALPEKLSDLGIDHNQSHRYQRIAGHIQSSDE